MVVAIEIGCEDEASEREKRRAQAKLELAFLRQNDRIAESYENLATRTDLSAAQIQGWREIRRIEYRRATGVEIEQRSALKAGLRHLAETGEITVEELIKRLRQDYANGLSSDDAASRHVGIDCWGRTSWL
jgi:hypothetical protein